MNILLKNSLPVVALLAGIACFPAEATAQASNNIVKIGVLNDRSGPYSDLSGEGSVVAAKMAAEDLGGSVIDVPIKIVSANHQNKPDVGAAIVRRWIDVEAVDAVADVPTSSVALAVQDIIRDKQEIFLISGAASAALVGKACSSYSIQTSDNTYALTHGVVRAVLENGGDTWFFVTANYVFGHGIEAAATALIEEAGGEVLGSVAHPPNTMDFSSYLIQAQASGAEVIGLANAGNDTVNAVQQASQFGINQQLVGMILFSSEIHALGLEAAQGLLLTEGFYWDMSEEAREWSRRFLERFGKMPTREQATTYATVVHYLEAIEAAGTDDAEAVMKKMKSMSMDYFGQQGFIRLDGRFVHDLALYEVKSPDESTGRWDIYNKVRDIPGEHAFRPLEESECPLVNVD